MESRALFFNPEVCRLITEKCIPFTRNSLVKSGYAADDPFWNRIQKQGVDLGNNLYLCTADGRVMDGFRDPFLGTWLAAWNKLPEARRRPGAIKVEDRGPYQEDPRNPRPPAGVLVVKTYMRALDRDAEGRLFTPEKLSLGYSKTVIKAEPNRDFLWLTRDEWQSLLPGGRKPGETYPVPAALRERIFRFHLVDGARCLPGFWTRKEIHAGDLTLSVEESSPSRVRLRLTGFAKAGPAKHVVEFTVRGALTYDVTKKELTRFDVAAVSKAACHPDIATGRLLPLGVAFELGRPDSPADRRLPFRIWYDRFGVQEYLGLAP